MNKLLLNILLLINFTVLAQIDADALMVIPMGTTTQLDEITSPTPQIGSLAFDTDKDRLVQYTTQGWLELLTASNVYVGAFQINRAGTITVNNIPFRASQITFTANTNVETSNVDSDNGTGNNDRGIANSFGTMNGFARRNIDNSISQQSIYSGGHGSSINDISRYASSSNCIGMRYGNQNGSLLGKIEASLSAFTIDGFTLNVVYTNGEITVNNNNTLVDVQPTDINTEGLLVLFTAYR